MNWVEGVSSVAEIIKALATDLTMATNNGWSLAYPSVLSGITNTAIIRTKTSQGADAHVKLERPAGALNHMLITSSNKMNEAGNDIDSEISNVPARFAWYRLSDEVDLFEKLFIIFSTLPKCYIMELKNLGGYNIGFRSARISSMLLSKVIRLWT